MGAHPFVSCCPLTQEAAHSLVAALIDMEMDLEEHGIVNVVLGLPVLPLVTVPRMPLVPRCDVGSDVPGGGAA